MGAGAGLRQGHRGIPLEGGVVVDRARRSSSTPQWPWSVNSSRHRSAMTTRSSPTASTTAREGDVEDAVGVVGAGADARPSPSGTPKTMIPPSPASTQRRASSTSDSRVCWTTPGIAEIGTGVVDALARRRPAARARPGAAASRRRAAGSRGRLPQPAGRATGREARRRRSRGPATRRRGRFAGSAAATGSPASLRGEREAERPWSASASTSASAVASGASTSTRRPCSSAVLAVAGPMQATTVVGCGLPAMPTRLRTVELDVKTHGVERAALDRVAHRRGRRGGPHGAVGRDVVDLPAHLLQARDEGVGGDVGARQEDPVDRVEDVVEGAATPRAGPAADCSPDGTRSGVDAPVAQRLRR